MPRESWVHPVTGGQEARSHWFAIWGFRLILLLLLAVAVVLGYDLYRSLTGNDSPASGLGPLLILRP